MKTTSLTLEEQREEYSKRKFIATPLAGTMVWLLIGISGLLFDDQTTVLVLFIGTGSIVYIGMFFSKLTGENFLDKSKPKNVFDNLFLFTVGQAFLVYAIAIPFFLIDHSSLPLTVGILTGIMWIPFSWIINHWVGLFHGIARTLLIVALWYLLPELRFVTIPFAIVFIYLITMVILKLRKKTL